MLTLRNATVPGKFSTVFLQEHFSRFALVNLAQLDLRREFIEVFLQEHLFQANASVKDPSNPSGELNCEQAAQ